jgi:hypothetical protein
MKERSLIAQCFKLMRKPVLDVVVSIEREYLSRW